MSKDKYTTIRIDKWLAEELKKDMNGTDTMASRITSLLAFNRLNLGKSVTSRSDEKESMFLYNGWAEVGDTVVAVSGPSGKYDVVEVGKDEYDKTYMMLEPKDRYTQKPIYNHKDYMIWTKGSSNEA